MRSSRRRIAGRMILPAILGVALVWVYSLHRNRDHQPDFVYTPRLSGVEEAAELVFRSSSDSVIVESINGEFWITHPIRDRADPSFIAELLRYVRTVQPSRILHDSLDVEVGLSPARSVVRLRVPDGRRWSIEVGDTSPIGSQVYTRVRPGGDGIFLFDHFLARRFLTPSVTTMRDKRAAPVDAGPVDSLDVLVPGLELRARRLHRDNWTAVYPGGVNLHTPSLNACVQELRTPVIRGFPEPGLDLREVGLDPPRAIWVIYQRASVDSVRIGDATADRRSLYILPSGRSEPALMDPALEDRLTGGWPALADRSLLESGVDDWTAISFLQRPDSIGYVLSNEGWALWPAGTRLSNPTLFLRDLGNLTQLRWKEFPWPAESPPKTSSRIVLELRSAARAETLELASPVDSISWARSSSRPIWGRITPFAFRTWSHRMGRPDS